MTIIISPYSRKLRNGETNPKDYPTVDWSNVIMRLEMQGHRIIQIGVEGEMQLAKDFRKNLSLKQIEELLLEADTWISVDNFLQHFGWYLEKKGIAIFSQSDPEIFGHKENVNLLKDRSYLRVNQFDIWERAIYNPDAYIAPELVADALELL